MREEFPQARGGVERDLQVEEPPVFGNERVGDEDDQHQKRRKPPEHLV